MDKSKQKFVLRYFQQVVVISDVAVAVSDQKKLGEAKSIFKELK